jgi:Leucine-rich repeat (LRR) protein
MRKIFYILFPLLSFGFLNKDFLYCQKQKPAIAKKGAVKSAKKSAPSKKEAKGAKKSEKAVSVAGLSDSDIAKVQGDNAEKKKERWELLCKANGQLSEKDLTDDELELLLSKKMLDGQKSVDVSKNPKITLASAALKNFKAKKFESLDLSETGITGVAGIVFPDGLKRLLLGNNKGLKSIEGFGVIKGLKVFDLRGIVFDKDKDTSLALLEKNTPALEELVLKGVNVTTVGLKALPVTLRAINIRGGAFLTELPDMSKLTKLEKLSLSGTKIKVINFNTLPKGLKVLWLAQTPLEIIRGEFPSTLEELFLSETSFTTMPTLPLSLRILDMSGTNEKLKPECPDMSKCKNLKRVWMTGSPIQNITKDKWPPDADIFDIRMTPDGTKMLVDEVVTLMYSGTHPEKVEKALGKKLAKKLSKQVKKKGAKGAKGSAKKK